MDKMQWMNLRTHSDRLVLYLITLSVCLVWITIGVSSAWPSVAYSKIQRNETALRITKDEIGWMNSVNPIGFTFGSLVTRWVADMLGRRITVLASALPMALGSVVASFASTAWHLYLTRFMWGFATGMAKTVVPMYLAEVADKHVRATLMVFTRVGFNLGLLLVMTTGGFVPYEYLNYTLVAFSIIYLTACYWIPESPYYHLKEGRVDAASKELTRIWRNKDKKELKNELKLMQANVDSEMQRSSNVIELFTGRRYRKAIIIAAFLQLTSSMTGLVSVRNYLGSIIEQSKSAMDVKTVFIVFGIVQFVVGIMSSAIVDRVGRRPLLYFSLFGTGICLATLSLYFFFLEVKQVDHQALRPYGYVPFIAIILAFIISTLGFNSIILVIPAEIFPMNVKAVAMTSLSIYSGILGFGMGKGYQVIVNFSGLCGVFCVFSCFAIAGGLFVLLYVPETKGKTLKEIQIILLGDMYIEDEIDTLNQTKDPEVDNVVETHELKQILLSENNDKV